MLRRRDGLNGNGRRNMRVRVVSFEGEIFGFVIEKVLAAMLHDQLRQRARFARKLQLSLFQMVRVKMDVPASPDEGPGLQLAFPREHVG